MKNLLSYKAHALFLIVLAVSNVGILTAFNFAGHESLNGKTIKLFNGKSLKGWQVIPGGTWEVKDGMIIGKSPKGEERHGLLVSDSIYKDFVANCKFKHVKGNSGFYFRAEKVAHIFGVYGFQAEIDPSYNLAGLYETGGRGWVANTDSTAMMKIYKANDWNKMTVSAIGRDIKIYLNDHLTAELKNDPGRLQGHFALQLHGGMDMEVMFKDITVEKK